MIYFIGAGVILLPLYVRMQLIPGSWFKIDLAFGQNLGFAFFVALFLILIRPRQKASYPPWQLILAGVGLMTHSFFLTFWGYHAKSNMVTMGIGAGTALLLHIVRTMEKADIEKLKTCIWMSGVIQAGIMAMQMNGYQYHDLLVNTFSWITGIPMKWKVGLGEPVGVMMQTAHSGACIAVCVPFCTGKWWRWLALPLMLWAVFTTTSLMAIGAALFSLVAVFIFKYWKHIKEMWVEIGALLAVIYWLLTGMGGLVIYKSHPFWDDQSRFKVWGEIWQYRDRLMDLRTWLIGHGTGFWGISGPVITSDYKPPWGHPHNEGIWFIMTFGLLGVLLITPAVWKIFKMRNKDAAVFGCFVAILCNSFGNYTLHLIPAMTVGVIALSIACYSDING